MEGGHLNKILLTKFSAILLALALPCGAYAAPGGGSNTTAQASQAQVTSVVAKTAATANIGMLSSRITTLVQTPAGGSGGGSGGGIGGGSGGGRGQSSGNGPEGIGVWALGGWNWLDSSKSGGKFDGSLSTAMVGMDKQIGNLILGVAAGFEKLDLTTKYNGGNMLYDGWSITPYVAYSITKDLVADASFSYTWLDYTMKDTQAGVKYSDDMSAERRVVSAGLTQYMPLDKLLLSGRLGTLYLNEHQGSYNLNTTPYGNAGIYTWQGSFGLRGTYDLGSFKPFLGATYMQDFLKSGPSNDMWGTDIDLGFTYNVSNSFLMGLTGTYGFRENLTKVGGMLNARYEF